MILLPIILIIGCIALICAVLTIDALDRKLADDAAGEGSDNDQPATATGFDGLRDPSFHSTLISPEAKRDHGDQ